MTEDQVSSLLLWLWTFGVLLLGFTGGWWLCHWFLEQKFKKATRPVVAAAEQSEEDKTQARVAKTLKRSAQTEGIS